MRRGKIRGQRSKVRGQIAFALYEVLMGLAIFALGVLALGRAVQNCLNASTLNAEEDRVRPGFPDPAKEFNVDTGYGVVKLVQKSVPAELEENNGTRLAGVNRVTLTVKWTRGGAEQSQQIEFYVYRPG